MRVFRALPSYHAIGSFRSWVLGITRHVCADEVRRRARHRSLLRRLTSTTVSSAPAAATDIELLVAALPTDQREAFVLTQLVGLSYDEAADACQCPVGTIRSRIARARAALIATINEGEQSEAR